MSTALWLKNAGFWPKIKSVLENEDLFKLLRWLIQKTELEEGVLVDNHGTNAINLHRIHESFPFIQPNLSGERIIRELSYAGLVRHWSAISKNHDFSDPLYSFTIVYSPTFIAIELAKNWRIMKDEIAELEAKKEKKVEKRVDEEAVLQNKAALAILGWLIKYLLKPKTTVLDVSKRFPSIDLHDIHSGPIWFLEQQGLVTVCARTHDLNRFRIGSDERLQCQEIILHPEKITPELEKMAKEEEILKTYKK